MLANQVNVETASLMSLMIGMSVRGQHLATGTGFVVEHGGQPFLVTNRHNLSGRRSDTNELLSKSTGATPDSVRIIHNHTMGVGNWFAVSEPLLDEDERPRWLEHPRLGRIVDVVALPLSHLEDVQLYPYALENHPDDPGNDIHINVTTNVNVVGFPFSISHGGFFAIWTRGTIATEFEIDYEGKPAFLIDSRTRKGQSGSPVFFFLRGGFAPLQNGSMSGFTHASRFLGIYSGRINDQSDLGIVWKTEAIREVVCEGVRPAT